MAYYYEKRTGRLVKWLARFYYYERDTVLHLMEFVDIAEQFIISQQDLDNYFTPQQSLLTTDEKLRIYCSLFKGRTDVYAKSYINDEGRIQYYPSYHYGWRHLPPEKRTCQPLTNEVLKSHLRGETSIGIFPISEADTCSFLALDFDGKDWRDVVSVLRKVAEQQACQAHVEISRSGNGAHVWFFFEEMVSCQLARRFGKILLELAMQLSDKIDFSSYDRMFPNQDFLPKGGFGNLIALPLQGEAYKKGCTVFVDENFKPYTNQWEYLQGIEKIGTRTLEAILSINVMSQQDDGCLEVQLSNVLSVKKANISVKTAYFLKRLASFSNPEFYLKQASRQPTYQTPSRLYLFEEDEEKLLLPRGLLADLKEAFEEVKICDRRYQHETIQVSFTGDLHFAQELALTDLISNENGLLCAETGFGKTVLGAALIAKRQKRTIILVHNRQLMDQWLDRLSNFLIFGEEEAVRYTPSGREKKIGHIGQYGSAKKWRSKLVDVVMIQSLFQLEYIKNFLADYDMMIVDECHHVTALQFEKVVAQFAGQYLYGLTATPERKNGHEPIVYQRIGPILHQAVSRQVHFEKELYLRFTSFGKLAIEKVNSTNFAEINDWLAKDEFRNQMIVEDICQAYGEHRKVLVLVNRVEHIEILRNALAEKKIQAVFAISGRTKRKEAKEIVERVEGLDSQLPFVLISTGKFIGEGFDLPKLDTLVLAAPLSWKNNLIQYAGRLHRPYEGKETVQVIDYIDIHLPYLEKMYQKRQKAYKQMAYQLKGQNQKQTLFDVNSFEKAFYKDIQQVHDSVYLQLTSISRGKLLAFMAQVKDKSLEIQISKHHKLSQWLKELEGKQVKVILSDKAPSTNLLIIDKSIVWYGSLSPLGYQTDEQASLLRLESNELAEEFSQKKH